MNCETSNAIPINGQQFLLETAFVLQRGTLRGGSPSSRKSSELTIASRARALLHAVVDRRYTKLFKSKKSRSGELRSGFDFVFLGYFRIGHLLLPIAGCAQALEVLEEARLNRCAIGLHRNSEELIARDTAIGRVLDYRADCITQRIIVRARRDSDVTPAQQAIDVARARDDGSTIEGLTVLAGQ